MLGQVYVIENELGLVKIGISSKPERRIKEIANASGLKITKKYFSEPCYEFAQIEKKMHHYFSKNRKKGEWFDIQFDADVNALNNHFEAAFPINSSSKKYISLGTWLREKLGKSTDNGILLRDINAYLRDVFGEELDY